jgi:hypothetical protein
MSSAYDKYVRGKILGKGSFGQAVLVSRRSDGKQFVIKEIDISRMPKAEREQAEQEAKVRAELVGTYGARPLLKSALTGCCSESAAVRKWVTLELAMQACLSLAGFVAADGAQPPQHRALLGVLHPPEQAVHCHGLVLRGWVTVPDHRHEPQWLTCSNDSMLQQRCRLTSGAHRGSHSTTHCLQETSTTSPRSGVELLCLRTPCWTGLSRCAWGSSTCTTARSYTGERGC